eukprot:scaffold1048_cov135-Skeletonema_marinoi.AAC.14
MEVRRWTIFVVRFYRLCDFFSAVALARRGKSRPRLSRVEARRSKTDRPRTKFGPVVHLLDLALPHIMTFTATNELTNLIFNQTGVCITHHRAVRLSTDH